LHITILVQNFNLDSVTFFKKFLKGHEIKLERDASNISNTDLVIIRNHGMDYVDNDLEICKSIKTKFLNPPQALMTLRDKYLQYNFIQELRPIYVKTTLDYHCLDFPMIMKTRRGMKGFGVYLVHSEDEIKKIQNGDQRYIYQSYLKNKTEYRYIYFLGEQLFLKNHAGNFKNFEQYTEVELTKEWLNLFEQIRLALGLNFFAIDCFKCADQLYIIDINGVPGTKLLENFMNPTKLLKCQENLSLI
jgi:glutathione synthase/RimK-type ligase-like ATP-grasp enzyme